MRGTRAARGGGQGREEGGSEGGQGVEEMEWLGGEAGGCFGEEEWREP